MRRLEEASIAARGPERIHLLRRWLAALKETQKPSEGSIEDDDKNHEPHLVSKFTFCIVSNFIILVLIF